MKMSVKSPILSANLKEIHVEDHLGKIRLLEDALSRLNILENPIEIRNICSDIISLKKILEDRPLTNKGQK